MCGRVIQSSTPFRLAIVDGLDVRDTRVHNYPDAAVPTRGDAGVAGINAGQQPENDNSSIVEPIEVTPSAAYKWCEFHWNCAGSQSPDLQNDYGRLVDTKKRRGPKAPVPRPQPVGPLRLRSFAASRVRITNVTNGRSVTVRINDRGPFVPGRVVDVSYSAAESLGMTERGHRESQTRSRSIARAHNNRRAKLGNNSTVNSRFSA